MAGGSAPRAHSCRSGVRIVVAGDHGTGKSTLISAVSGSSNIFPHSFPDVLPPTRLPEHSYPDRVPVTIIDTSSRLEDRNKLSDELRGADAVILTYACDKTETFDRLSSFWIPELHRLEVKVPVVVVGCKLDLRDENQQASLEDMLTPIMLQFREIEICIECSAHNDNEIHDVFLHAQKAVLHPVAPLFDQETQSLTPRCMRALKRIFVIFDCDRDGALGDKELKNFQMKCFNSPLQPSEIKGVKRVVRDSLMEGVNHRGLTLAGFLFLHALFIKKGRPETTWAVLRMFGYNNEIELGDNLLPVSFNPSRDQSVELTDEAIAFLEVIFRLFDIDGDEALCPDELNELFSTAPESPWDKAPYKDVSEKNLMGGLSLDGFISQWAFMALTDTAACLENLIYIGYDGDPSSAIHVTRKRRTDKKKQQSERNVYQCFVFGPRKSGKSTLLNSFIGRPFCESYRPTIDARFAVNVIDKLEGDKKTLVLKEIMEDEVEVLLSDKESMAACDVALFLYDSSDEGSWNTTAEVLNRLAAHGERTGYGFPSLIVAAKDDTDRDPTAMSKSTRLSQDMGIEAPIPVSTRLGETNNLFQRIVKAAEHPHLSIPETEAGRSFKHHHDLVNRSLMITSVGAAMVIVGLAAYRVYITRKKNSSS